LATKLKIIEDVAGVDQTNVGHIVPAPASGPEIMLVTANIREDSQRTPPKVVQANAPLSARAPGRSKTYSAFFAARGEGSSGSWLKTR